MKKAIDAKDEKKAAKKEKKEAIDEDEDSGSSSDYVDNSAQGKMDRLQKAIKHNKLDANVVKQAQECNKYMEAEGSRSISCKINNLKELEQALSNKK